MGWHRPYSFYCIAPNRFGGKRLWFVLVMDDISVHAFKTFAFSVENRHRGPRRVCGPLLGWKTPLHNGRQEFLAANKLHRSINDTVELERFESNTLQENRRATIRTQLEPIDKNKPLYLEAYLASRWFSPTYSKHFFDLIEVERGGGKPFVEVLLDAVDNPNGAGVDPNIDAAAKKTAVAITGTRFEAAACLLSPA